MQNAALVIGSSFAGIETPEAEFEEIFSFAAPLSEAVVAAYYDSVSKIAALGALTVSEEQARQLAYAQSAAQKAPSLSPEESAQRSSMLESMGACASELAISKSADDNTITVTVTNGVEG